MPASAQPGLLSPEQRPFVRRLSSATASFDDLSIGPAVVAPPGEMEKPTDAHETAVAMEMAKYRLVDSESTDSEPSSPQTPPDTTTTDSYAYAFDIDGVLVRGGKPIPEAIEAMKVLNGANEWGIKVYVLRAVLAIFADAVQALHFCHKRWR